MTKYNNHFFAEARKTLSLNSPIALHLQWAADNIYLKNYPNRKDKDGIARYQHGALHVGRCAFYIPILANLHRKFGDLGALKRTDDDVKLLQIAAIYHDSGREDEGVDHWDLDSAVNVFEYLRTLEVPIEKACALAEAVANKDFSGIYPEKYYEFKSSKDGKLKISHKNYAGSKPIYAQLIQGADCLDVKRVRNQFDGGHLDFYKHVVVPQANPEALNMLAQLIAEIKSVLVLHGDISHSPNSAKKKNYESCPVELYDLIQHDVEKPLFDGARILMHPLMTALYHHGTLATEDELRQCNIEQLNSSDSEEKNLIQTAWRDGNLFARGIRTPSALAKHKGHKESFAGIEIRKINRKKGEKTQTGKLDKQGNRKRSVSRLGWSATTYSSSGLLVLNKDKKNILTLSHQSLASGYGKERELPEAEQADIETQLNRFDTIQKLGGRVGESENGHLTTHNEFILDRITSDMMIGVFFTLDCTVMNERVARENGQPQHPYAPILEAIYIQTEYFLQTKIRLPIYQISGTHNYIFQRNYSDNQIADMWKEVFINFFKIYTVPTMDDEIIEKIKNLSLYRKNPYYHSDKPKPLDSNYTIELKQQVDSRINEVIKGTALIRAIKANDISQAEHSLSAKTKDEILGLVNETFGEYRRSPLFFATSAQIILFLIKSGAVIGAKDSNNDTPLTLAACKGLIDATRALLKQGADPATQGDMGLTALSWAAKEGHSDVIRILIGSNKEGVTALNQDGTSAIPHAKNDEVLALLCSHLKPTPQDKEWLNKQLFDRLSKSKLAMVPILVQAGADVNLQNNEKNTALILLSNDGDARISILLELNADASLTGKHGLTALSWAVYKGHKKVVSLLLASRALGITSLNADGTSAISWTKDFSIMKALLDAGIKVTDPDKNRFNQRFHKVAEERGVNAVAIENYLKLGANINAEDANGDTPLSISARNGFDDNVELFLKLGANPFLRNMKGKNALDVATGKAKATLKNIGKEQACSLIGACIIAVMSGENKTSQSKNLKSLLKDFKKKGGLPTTVIEIHLPKKMRLSFLHAACFLNLLPVVKGCFKSFKAKTCLEIPNAVHNSTPLMFAAQGNALDVLDYLLKQGAVINAKNNEQDTALYFAAYANSADAAFKLLAKGADSELLYDGKSLLHLAVEQKSEKVIPILIQHKRQQLLRSGLSAIEAEAKLCEYLKEKVNGESAATMTANNSHSFVTILLSQQSAKHEVKEEAKENNSQATPKTGGLSPRWIAAPKLFVPQPSSKVPNVGCSGENLIAPRKMNS